MLIACNNDQELKAKLDIIIDELDRCRVLNGGKWLGSIPEKYFGKLERNEYIWSPQYTMHKTLLGLLHSYKFVGNNKALSLLSNVADWYLVWTADMLVKNPHAIYSGEEGGMLEVWADLYALTGDNRYLTLAERYNHPSIFSRLDEKADPLTDCHVNASIPWAHGSARMYEVTGDEKWLRLTLAFWDCAVKEREAYCTGGQGSGEYWVPPHKNDMFRNDRNQEFCTVYNMVRLADYLFRFTGETEYSDYIEKNLYNGFLAQQNRYTGMPTYFLPLKSGSHKKWGRKTHDFWCCHGTMVQSQTIYQLLCYYEDIDNDRLVISQYIPSSCTWLKGGNNINVSQSVDMKYYNDQAFFDENDTSQKSRWLMKLNIKADTPVEFTVSLRIPAWTAHNPTVTVNGVEVAGLKVIDGYINIKRIWDNDAVTLYLPAALSLSTLPDRADIGAVMEGPIVLAGLCEQDTGLYMKDNNPANALTPVVEHTYGTFPWMQSCYRSVGQNANISFVPLYEVTDEAYTVYFTIKH